MNNIGGMEHQTSAVRPVHGRGRRVILTLIIVTTLGAFGFLWWGGVPTESPGGERPFSGSGAVLSLAPPPGDVAAGDVFTVGIVLDAVAYNVSAVDIALEYEPGFLEVVDVGGVEGFISLSENSDVSGKVSLVVGSGTTPVSGGGRVAEVAFRALRSGETRVFLDERSQAAAVGHGTDIIRELRHTEILIR